MFKLKFVDLEYVPRIPIWDFEIMIVLK